MQKTKRLHANLKIRNKRNSKIKQEKPRKREAKFTLKVQIFTEQINYESRSIKADFTTTYLKVAANAIY
jgi:hypothetical protein